MTRDVVLIEAALNGGRSRREHPRVPCTPREIADDARRCAAAGAAVVHIHAQNADGRWSADPAWYAEAHRRIRDVAPGLLISITSIRPADQPVSAVLDLLDVLAADPTTRPDMISINLGHIAAWEPSERADMRRRTVHFPNDHDDIAVLLAHCERLGIVPELGVMDIGFVSNAVALRDDGLLSARPWFLIELDSPAYGAGRQVAPATAANYDLLAGMMAAHFPGARWAGHGNGLPGYAVIRRALETGAHIRVGLEDATHLPDGHLAPDNAFVVAWAVAAARRLGRAPARFEEAWAIIGGSAREVSALHDG